MKESGRCAMSPGSCTPAPPPAAPGSGATLWRCRCGNLLGIIYGRWVYSRHRGRAVEATLPARVQCEVCGRKQVRHPDSDTDSAADADTGGMGGGPGC